MCTRVVQHATFVRHWIDLACPACCAALPPGMTTVTVAGIGPGGCSLRLCSLSGCTEGVHLSGFRGGGGGGTGVAQEPLYSLAQRSNYRCRCVIVFTVRCAFCCFFLLCVERLRDDRDSGRDRGR